MLEKNQQVQLEKDNYTLIELIGEGGQGVIWLVKAESTGELCVLKTICTHKVSHSGRPQLLTTFILDELSRRMQEEINFFLAVRDKETHFIATCLDHGMLHYDGVELPTMIMPRYQQSLAQQIPYHVDQMPEYDLSTVLKWLRQLSEALQCTHEQIIDGQPYMHRDIKPANILLTENGDIRLIDFGIAKQQSDDTGTTSIAHSPAWAAPEQVLPESVRDNGDNVFRLTEKTDLYSAGLVAYYLCTGGSEPKTQKELRERNQAIYTQHVSSLSVGKVGKLGEVGGLTKDDKAYLQRCLLDFFARDGNKSAIMPTVEPSVICEQIVATITQSLLPIASERPRAKQIKQQFHALQLGLSPQLDTFSVISLKRKLLLGEGLTIDIQLSGQGLMLPLDCLKIIDNKRKKTVYPFSVLSVTPEADVFLSESSLIQLRLTAFNKVGDYHLRALVQVGEQIKHVDIECVVTASAEQLWQQGQHEAALKKDLREEWLDVLEQEARGSIKQTSHYLDLLEALKKQTSHQEKQADLIARYQRIDAMPVTTNPNKKILIIVGGIVLLGGLSFAAYQFTRPPTDNTFSNNLSEPASQITKPTQSKVQQPIVKKSFEPEMVKIPAGSFEMGCVSKENCQDDEKPVHKVTLSSFFISKTEVTFAQWDACVEAGTCSKAANDNGWGHDQRPVINVSWNDTQDYLQWLNKETSNSYRLPNEAEWEYAARAKSKTKYAFGNDVSRLNDYAWYGYETAETQTHPVTSKKSNLWGLYGMHGNVEEWVQDCYHKNYNGAPTDGNAWTRGDCNKNDKGDIRRVHRGGGWEDFADDCRSANRSVSAPNYRNSNLGFRIVRKD